MTLRLPDFLQDRLDEDEAAAKAAQSRHAKPHGSGTLQAVTSLMASRAARDRREVKAKRAILRAEMDRALGGVVGYSSVLLDLAAIYSDHPDYRQEWKP